MNGPTVNMRTAKFMQAAVQTRVSIRATPWVGEVPAQRHLRRSPCSTAPSAKLLHGTFGEVLKVRSQTSADVAGD